MPLKTGGPNLTRRLIAVGVNGAPTAIFATGFTRGWRIIESPGTLAGGAQTSQGFQVQIPNDNGANGFAQWFTRPAVNAAVSPLEVYFENWNRIAAHGPYGEAFAGPGNATPGLGIAAPTSPTLLANVQSLTATATVIEIEEFF